MDSRARISNLETIGRIEGGEIGETAFKKAAALRERHGLIDWMGYMGPPRTKRRRVTWPEKRLFAARYAHWWMAFMLRVKIQPPRPRRARRRSIFTGAYDMVQALESGKRQFVKVYWRNLQQKQVLVKGKHQLLGLDEIGAASLNYYMREHVRMANRLQKEMHMSSVPEHDRTLLAFRIDMNDLLADKCMRIGMLVGLHLPGPIAIHASRPQPAEPMTEGEIPSGTWWKWVLE